MDVPAGNWMNPGADPAGRIGVRFDWEVAGRMTLCEG